jgi:ABC-type glycerol-3-phosphate transport system permease component
VARPPAGIPARGEAVWSAADRSNRARWCPTLLALVLAVGAGYGFARFRFFGRDLLAVSVLFSQLLPARWC